MELKASIGSKTLILVAIILSASILIPGIIFFINYHRFENFKNDISLITGDAYVPYVGAENELEKILPINITLIVLILILYLYIYLYQKKAGISTFYNNIFIFLILSSFIVLILSIPFTSRTINELSVYVNKETSADRKDILNPLALSQLALVISSFFLIFFAVVIYSLLEKNPYITTDTKRKRKIRKTLIK